MEDIPGYEGLYAITKDGRVWTRQISSRNPGGGRWLSQQQARNGYILADLTREGGRKRRLVHRLVALTYIPNPEQKQCVNHINGDKTDNRVENLEWCTYRENQLDLIAKGRGNYAIGERAHNAILNEKMVREIRAKYKPGIYTVKMLAEEYGITRGCLEPLLSGKTWKHIA